MTHKTIPRNSGAVTSVRGSVVDNMFDKKLPPIHSLLYAGADRQISIEVFSHRVRGTALTPTQGLSRGMRVEDSGAPLFKKLNDDGLEIPRSKWRAGSHTAIG